MNKLNFDEDIEAAIASESNRGNLMEKCWGVKIILHHSTGYSAIQECIYYNKGFRFKTFMRWQWYFRYRAALFQVQNPKYYAELVTFDYEQKPTDVEIVKRRKDVIAARRRNLTIYQNRLSDYEKAYTGLFPIADDPKHQKARRTVDNYEKKLNEAQNATTAPIIDSRLQNVFIDKRVKDSSVKSRFSHT